ncbi:MAG: DUF1538 domain-containing protein [Lentisphaeria bacterium]|nr:DUF1538 domain-containing protein [Lentisphaeria bacterium]
MSSRLREQLKSVAFIVIYLVAFQMLVFGRAPAQALVIAGGIALVVVGLALFLEGLILGLMPLAQRVGIQLTSHGGLKIIIPIGFCIGAGATFAEPAIAALRAVGSTICAWDAPLLFFLLQQRPEWLISAIAIGVGIAAAIGLMRFYLGFSIKPIILGVLALVLPISVLAAHSSNLAAVLGLAWDAGAVTTGPVTVPLMLALGVGISRSSGRSESAADSFGTVALASVLPVLTVLALGILLLPHVPQPCSEEEFFSPAMRPQAVALLGGDDALRAYALRMGSAAARAQFAAAGDPDGSGSGGGAIGVVGVSDAGVAANDTSLLGLLREESGHAARAVLPLTVFLALILFLLLRDRPRYLDEVALGITFCLLGMCLLGIGIRVGLSQLGNQVGARLPQVYRDTTVEKGQIVIKDFDPAILIPAASRAGGSVRVFQLLDGQKVQTLTFNPDWYNEVERVYTHHVRTSPLIHPELTRIGLLLILLFAFGMGYGSTVAEPALKALGRTVEDLTVGTVKSVAIIRAVSIGVGIGLIVGVIRILYNIPMTWMLLPPYLLLFPLTIANDDDFAGIAWDCGGVTTGAITVPLVLAMGLGLGEQLNIADGFGILAMASVYPILTVMLFGVAIRMRERTFARAAEGANDHE